MKLFVHTQSGKRYLEVTASTRQEIADMSEGEWIEVEGMNYNVSDVFAEEYTSKYNTIIWMLIGAFIGLLIKPIGAIGGGVIGAIIGGEVNRKELQEIEIFNESCVLK